MTAREALLFRYVRGWSSFVTRNLPSPGDFFYTSTPHFHWDIVLSAVLQANGWRGFAFAHQSAVDGHLLLRRLKGAQMAELIRFPDRQRVVEKKQNRESAYIAGSLSRNAHILGSPKSRGLMAMLLFLPKFFWYALFPHRFPYFSFSRFRLTLSSIRWGVN